MAYKSDRHGGNGKTAEQVTAMQTKFVHGVLSGEKPADAALSAGYSPGTHPHEIVNRIRQALESEGLTPERLAKEYVEGIGLAKANGARDKDLNALSQMLKQLGWLLGANRKELSGPAVAVQINNGPVAAQPGASDIELHEPGGLEAATREALAEWRTLRGDLERVDEEISRRESGDILDADTGVEDPGAHT